MGVHKTNNPNDSYLGSGNYIRRAVAKYGKQGFTKQILFEFKTQAEAWLKENELVELGRTDPSCMNLRKGGSGGFDYINPLVTHEGRVARGKAMNATIKKRLDSDPLYKEEWLTLQRKRFRKAQIRSAHPEIKKKAADGTRRAWLGNHHTEETKARMREKAQQKVGCLNSQFGSRWVTNGIKNMKIKDEEIPDGWKYGRVNSRQRCATSSTMQGV